MRQVVVAFFVCSALLVAAEPVPLFNGKDLSGWEMVGPGRFVVEDGMMKTEGGMGLLYYRGRKLGNETLRVVFKTSGPRDNSGVVIRMPEPPPDPWYGVHNGHEVQIAAGGDAWHSTGSIYSLSKAEKQTQKAVGEWNTMEIQLDGVTTRISVNGELVNEFKPDAQVPERKQWYEPVRGPRPEYGYFGLQNHDRNSVVYFREISVITPGKPLAQGDRERMLSYLHSTRKQVLDAIAGLSAEQLYYKPEPSKWSVAEVVEHLTTTEPALSGLAAQSLRTPVAADKKSAMKDEQIVAAMTDRTKRAEAPAMLRPTGRQATAAELGEAWKARRDATVKFFHETQADMRGRVVKSGFGEIDAYQFFLLVPAHTERHLLQINEVKASPGFPKK
ncbi:MAG: DinB family protein [Bryobacteraceae bacterium]|nr:DinB family protein [Bryobacteraceae bacterium]